MLDAVNCAGNKGLKKSCRWRRAAEGAENTNMLLGYRNFIRSRVLSFVVVGSNSVPLWVIWNTVMASSSVITHTLNV